MGAEDGHHGPVEVHGFSFGEGPDRLGGDGDSGPLVRADRVAWVARRGWEGDFGNVMAAGVVEREPAVAVGSDVPAAFMDRPVMGGTEHEEVRPVGRPAVGPMLGVVGSEAAPLGAAREPAPALVAGFNRAAQGRVREPGAAAQIEEGFGVVEGEAHPTITCQSAGGLRCDGMTIEFATAGDVFTECFDIDMADDFDCGP